jgi:acyl-coenzyme A synthetase/AMP-(fatty) acid ligase
VEKSLTSLLSEALAARGRDVLIDSGDIQVNCEQVLAHAEEVGAFFSRRGSDAVLFAADHGIGARVLYVSLLLSGVTAAPVHASTPRKRLETIAAALGTAQIVTAPEGGLAPLRSHGFTQIVSTRDATPRRVADGQRPAYVLHTSGSTGRPKGVPIPGTALKAYLEFITGALKWQPGGRFSANFDLSFDLALHDLLVPVLTAGVSCPSEPRMAVLPQRCVELHGLTEWFSVPGVAGFARETGSLPAGSLKGLDKSLFAGEAFQTRDAEYWAAATGSPVFNLYGPTEMTLAATLHEYQGDPYPTVPIGRAFDHLRAKTGSRRDPDELLLTGVQMFAGYVDPSDDADVFETDDDGVVWYRTGDRVQHCPAGFVFQGRLDTQVKVGGHRIDLMDVEHAFRGNPDVAESVAFLHPTTRRLCVALHLRAGCNDRTPAGWRQFAADTLPGYMIPSRYFVLRDIPRNTNGKIDRRKTALDAVAREQTRSTPGSDRAGRAA